MLRWQLLILGTCLLLVGCEEESVNLENEFAQLDAYQLTDFNLAVGSDYLEIRRGDAQQADVYEVLFEYDTESYTRLTESQKESLDVMTAARGYRQALTRDKHEEYAVSIVGDDVSTITTLQELLDLFGEIDQEAELAIWLQANDYEGITFEASEDGGFEATARWDDYCGERGVDHLAVSSNGDIRLIDRIFYNEYEGCRI